MADGKSGPPMVAGGHRWAASDCIERRFLRSDPNGSSFERGLISFPCASCDGCRHDLRVTHPRLQTAENKKGKICASATDRCFLFQT